jgi:hypothetical protein
MDRKNLREKVLSAIKEKKIRQKARWKFLLHNYGIWVIGLVFMLLGSFVFSAMLYILKNNVWEEYSYFNDSLFNFFILSLPYFWILFLALFIFVADFYLKKTKGGYKYPVSVLALSSVLVSVLFGSLFYSIGIGEAIDDVLSERAPLYKEIINPHMQRWCHPEEGLLSGKITSFNSDTEFILEDINDNTWIVFHNNNLPSSSSILEEKMQVNMVGEKLSSDSFRADVIRTMGTGKGFFQRNHNGIGLGCEENPEFFKERMQNMPRMLKKHLEMKDIFQDHIHRHRGEIELFLDENPEYREKFEVFYLN